MDRIIINKQFPLIYLITIFILLTLSFSTNILAQTGTPQDYGARYKVNIGDSMSYKISKLSFNGTNYLPSYLQIENGSYIAVNITQGSTLTIIVTNINESLSFVQQPNGTFVNILAPTVYSKITFNISGKSYYEPENQYSGYIFQAFDNESMVDAYVNYMNKFYSNSTITNSYTQTYTVKGDYLTTIQTTTQAATTYYELIYNWRTGWLQSIDEAMSVGLTNNIEIRIDRISSNSNNIISSL